MLIEEKKKWKMMSEIIIYMHTLNSALSLNMIQKKTNSYYFIHS